MSTRYLTNSLAALLGGFIVVVSQAFGVAIVTLAALAELDRPGMPCSACWTWPPWPWPVC